MNLQVSNRDLSKEDKLYVRIDKEIKKHVFKKTSVTVMLSFSSLLLLLLWDFLQNNRVQFIEQLSEFIVKGSLLTIAISNISSVSANLALDGKFSDGTNKTYLVFKNRIKINKNGIVFFKSVGKKYTNSKEKNFLIWYSILLSGLTLCYAVLNSSDMNSAIKYFQISVFVVNIITLYKFNLFVERSTEEKYKELIDKIDSLYEEEENIERGKNVTKFKGIDL